MSLKLAALVIAFASVMAAQFTPASGYCAMAHCDSTMNDQDSNVPPIAVKAQQIDATGGASIGLGCSTNNAIVACSNNATVGVTVYNPFGTRICYTGSELDSSAYYSAPAIDSTGYVIGADSDHVAMFDPRSVTNGVCALVWASSALTGSPVSLVFDPANNVVLAATTGGYVYSIYANGASAGTVKNSVQMTYGGNTYQVSNTPCVQSGKIFVLTQRIGAPTAQKLFAYNTADLTDATGWSANPSAVSMTGPPYASPTCANGYVIFDDAAPSVLFVKQSDGTAASFSPVSLPAAAIASFALDPRGGVWVPMNSVNYLRRISTTDGSTVENLTLTSSDGITGVPNSAITIAGGSTSLYLITGVSQTGGRKAVAMWTLSTNNAVWTVYPDSSANGQFPTIKNGSVNAVFFTSRTGGVWMAAKPLSSEIGGKTVISGKVTIQ